MNPLRRLRYLHYATCARASAPTKARCCTPSGAPPISGGANSPIYSARPKR
jgi:hypothetical protein